MKPCCKNHVTKTDVASPTKCPECGAKWKVESRKWVSADPVSKRV